MAALARPRPRRLRKASWFERAMALLATLNLALVAFDLSYSPFRDRYLQVLPTFTQWYGKTLKGIEPERATTAYLALVDRLEAEVADSGLNAPETRDLLEELRDRSVDIVDENPFEVANKSGTLERIKNHMRERVEEVTAVEPASSKDAFREFWSAPYLSQAGWQDESIFFDQTVRPLFETNYWRGIDFSGRPIDRFWLIDIWFMGIFGLEFLARTYTLSRRHEDTTWFDAMLWRLYDVPLLLPFWRWLRAIPVVIRLNQAHLVNLEPIRGRLNRILISQFAVELTEVVFLRMIDQIQNMIRQGQITRWLFEATSQSRYIDLNGVDEIQTIAQRLTQVLIDGVLPKIKPDIDRLLAHSVDGALSQAPAYQGLKFLPGFSDLSHQLTQQISAEVSKNLYQAVKTALADERGGELMSQLVSSFGSHFREEIQKDDALREIQSLTTALLEEIKINYVERLAEEDIEKLEADRYRLYSTTQKNR
ncbi:MAG: hypothetical protein AAF152_03580 [Cyanobacteria bacterium P01_A01_bin.114]